MKITEFRKIFKKVDGVKVLKEYHRAGVLGFALAESFLLGYSKKSLEIMRLAVANKRLNKMRKKYRKKISVYKKEYENRKEHLEHINHNYIWVCWFQGLENAPEIVKRCYDSLVNNFPDRKIKLITLENYKEYIRLPQYIQDKFEEGIIENAHFSDILRLNLLIKYGGTWIDSTVFCSSPSVPNYMMNSDLFVFQTLKPGLDGHALGISNWFITSCSNNIILCLTRYLLYDYWKSNDVLIDYFIFHDFFQLSLEACEKEWAKVVPFPNSVPHILQLRLFDQYDPKVYEVIVSQSCFHKLTYKISSMDMEKEGTYYQHIMEQ